MIEKEEKALSNFTQIFVVIKKKSVLNVTRWFLIPQHGVQSWEARDDSGSTAGMAREALLVSTELLSIKTSHSEVSSKMAALLHVCLLLILFSTF